MGEFLRGERANEMKQLECEPMPDCITAPPRPQPKTRLQAIRQHCVDCTGGSYKEVENCTAGPDAPEPYYRCLLYAWRMGRNPARGPGVRNPSKTKIIRKYCLACMGGDRRLVRECANSNCAMHRFRLGALPKKPKQAVGASFSSESAQTVSQGAQIPVGRSDAILGAKTLV